MKKGLVFFIASLFIFNFSFLLSSAQTWQALIDSSNAYQEKRDFKTALDWAMKAEKIAKEELGELDSNYVTILGNVSQIYYNLGKIDSAVSYQKTHLRLCRNLFNAENPTLAESINNLAVFYWTIGNFAKAEPLFKEVLEKTRQIYKTDHPDLAMCLSNTATFYCNMGDYTKAEPLYKEALQINRRIYKTDHPDLAMGLNYMAYYYDIISDYTKAEPLYKESLEMYKRIYKTDHPNLAMIINNMAIFYQTIGDYTEAEPLLKEALDMRRRIYKTDHPDLATGINNSAVFYYSIGDYIKAEQLLKEALDMRRRIYKSNHPELASSINNMAAFYYTMGDKTKAELLYKEALEMKKRMYKTDHPDLVNGIYGMASLYYSIGDYINAEPLYKEALEMARRIYKTDHPDLATCIYDMAKFYMTLGDYDKAEPLYNEAIQMLRRIYKTENLSLAKNINNMAYFYYTLGDYTKAESLLKEALMSYQTILNNFFPALSEKEKGNFWNTMNKNYERFNTYAAVRAEDNSAILADMYNNQLNTKAILLNSTKKARNVILNSGDSLLVDKFNQWRVIRNQIAKYQKLSKPELEMKGIDFDSLLYEANEREKELSKFSEDFAREYDKKERKWTDVQNSLKDGQAAIELVRFRKYGKVPNRFKPEVVISGFTDTVYYAALIIKKDNELPELVLLENGKDLESKYIELYREQINRQRKKTIDYDMISQDLKELYTQFWQEIQSKLKGITTVYLSPDGVYNQFNLNTLVNPKTGKYLLEEIDLRMITSTRDLVEKRESPLSKQQKNSAVLFGDPQFNLDSVQYIAMADRYIGDRSIENYYLGNTIDSTTRTGITPLPGTRIEIEKISSELESKNWTVNKFLGKEALEEALKAVQGTRVLHIATHGKFLKDVEISGEDPIGMEKEKYMENPLLRSFLFFAGAEETLSQPDKYFKDREDGLLTAYEAMNLNLDNTELVVLSACETGLGKVRNGEGVYGLQRAFQVAGTRALIMSLWSVSDDATQELMVKFYKSWLSGKDKREAFREARMKLKEKFSGFYYWGAFVMVGE